jgi:hypothetical protein
MFNVHGTCGTFERSDFLGCTWFGPGLEPSRPAWPEGTLREPGTAANRQPYEESVVVRPGIHWLMAIALDLGIGPP